MRLLSFSWKYCLFVLKLSQRCNNYRYGVINSRMLELSPKQPIMLTKSQFHRQSATSNSKRITLHLMSGNLAICWSTTTQYFLEKARKKIVKRKFQLCSKNISVELDFHWKVEWFSISSSFKWSKKSSNSNQRQEIEIWSVGLPNPDQFVLILRGEKYLP